MGKWRPPDVSAEDEWTVKYQIVVSRIYRPEILNLAHETPMSGHSQILTRVLQKVLSPGSDYFSATFYQTHFYYKPSKYSPFTETHFCNILSSREKQINSLLLVPVGDTDK